MFKKKSLMRNLKWLSCRKQQKYEIDMGCRGSDTSMLLRRSDGIVDFILA